MEETEAPVVTLTDENGNEIECDVLFTCDSKETGKSYVVYTDGSLDENGQIQVFASSYVPKNDSDDFELEKIETEEELQFISYMLDRLVEEERKKAGLNESAERILS